MTRRQVLATLALALALSALALLPRPRVAIAWDEFTAPDTVFSISHPCLWERVQDRRGPLWLV